MPKKYVYFFGAGAAEGNKDMKDLLAWAKSDKPIAIRLMTGRAGAGRGTAHEPGGPGLGRDLCPGGSGAGLPAEDTPR